jgi:hypothetical protein
MFNKAMKEDNKSNKSNEEYILRNSYKVFELVKDVLRCLNKNIITRTALQSGRKSEEFNEAFC